LPDDAEYDLEVSSSATVDMIKVISLLALLLTPPPSPRASSLKAFQNSPAFLPINIDSEFPTFLPTPSN
jgi:hypothetical protein